ncbi:hypothetical protein HDU87_001122 [Geranomyces variabilis]|uniref:Uncharacterized protein n=1 Tax=Geranomyces variabilis TaxID=109894 RepID=A0AAD5TNR8_9FUNG|nr:hypothetical protein HDU87_001122 [Geranomyces variabilis]
MTLDILSATSLKPTRALPLRLAESFPDSEGITGRNMQKQEESLTAAFDAYATIFSQLVEDHALLLKSPGEAMMLVYSKNSELLRTIADALATPTLPKARAAEAWVLPGCRGGLLGDSIDLAPLPAPREVTDCVLEYNRDELPARVAGLFRSNSRRGTPTFENFKWGIVVPAGWLHVQKVEGISGDMLPGGNWINKYRKKLELNADDVNGHCAAIGAHTDGFTTPIGSHVFCYEASKWWLKKEGRSRRFHFILPLCPAHNSSSAVMKIKPNFPMLMVNSLHGSKGEGDWTRANATLNEPIAVAASENTPPAERHKSEPFYKLNRFNDWQTSTVAQQVKVQSNLTRIKSNLEHLKRGGVFQRDGCAQDHAGEEEARLPHVRRNT